MQLMRAAIFSAVVLTAACKDKQQAAPAPAPGSAAPTAAPAVEPQAQPTPPPPAPPTPPIADTGSGSAEAAPGDAGVAKADPRMIENKRKALKEDPRAKLNAPHK